LAPGAEAAARAAAARQVGVAAQAVPETYGKPESRGQRLVAVPVAAELVQVARAGEAEMAAVAAVDLVVDRVVVDLAVELGPAAELAVVALAPAVAADLVAVDLEVVVPEAEPAVGQVPPASQAGG